MLLELDDQSKKDLVLLAQHGASGRAAANRSMWDLVSRWGLGKDYEDLSHKTTPLVNEARKNLDRPPKDHKDRSWWSWSAYGSLDNSPFSPTQVPAAGSWRLRTGASGEPLPPPECWGPLNLRD